MSKQTLGLVGAASLLAGWMLASTASPPVARSEGGQTGQPAPPAPPDTSALSFEALQRRQAAPPVPSPQRNPFLFGGLRPTPGAEAPAPEPVPTERGDAWSPPAVAALHLAGVASRSTPDGVVFTAIVSDGREVWLLGRGDALPDGRLVVRVDEGAAVLVDPFGAETVLRLR